MIRFEVCPACMRKIERTRGLGRVRRILEACPTCRAKIGEYHEAHRRARARSAAREALAFEVLRHAVTRGIRI